jgi:hypothetical protein
MKQEESRGEYRFRRESGHQRKEVNFEEGGEEEAI